MTKAIQAVDNGLAGTLNWLTRIGPEPVQITLRNGNRAWDLSKDFEGDGSEDGGRISCPSWSPKGDKIAIFVSFDAIGMEGFRRLDQQYQLVLISPHTGESESVLSGVYDPRSIEWSPDGRRIAFVGSLANDISGVWLFDVESESLFLVIEGEHFEGLSWSPDSQYIAVIWCDGIECEKSEIRQYTMP
jgi:WD40 repeat protein